MTDDSKITSVSSSSAQQWTYDVFLSFRGEDTRMGFTGSPYNALNEKGFQTFIDDKLIRGEEITPALLKAIEESRIAIVIFSENYASSTFCLEEPVKILECIRQKGRLILPVFYQVEPSDVRKLSGKYQEAFVRHEAKSINNKEKVQTWKLALHQTANLSGWHFKQGNGYEYKFIRRIIAQISKKISRIPLHVPDYPVGLESRAKEVISLLDVGSDERVIMVGIHGIGGIGKTTIARMVYIIIVDQFEGVWFLFDVRENSIKHGLVHLQETLLSEVLGEKEIKVGTVCKGIPIIRRRLQRKKVLLILDDVDSREQLSAIVGRRDWFGSGNKIIITTRYKQFLDIHGIKTNYEVKEMSHGEALKLFTWNAFNVNDVDSRYMGILKNYCSGLPLALEIIGSNLFDKGPDEWKSALDTYERIPEKRVQKILKYYLVPHI